MPAHPVAREDGRNPMEVVMSTTFDHASLSFGAGGYSFAVAHMAAQRREMLRRTVAERWRRHMLSVLDAAVDQCERRNLAAPDGIGDVAPPELVLALIEQLQLELRREIRPPSCNQDALDMLFGLQRAFMPGSDDDPEEGWG